VNFTHQPMVGDAGKIVTQPNVLQGANTGSGSKLIRLTDISGSKVNWAEQARTIWYATLQDSPLEIPTSGNIEGALKAGIQCIPIPFFYIEDMSKGTPAVPEDILKSWKLWQGFAWKLKEKEARFKRPAPIVPAPPNPRMNARVDPTLKPGQTRVQ
jgi:hypothetical protein